MNYTEKNKFIDQLADLTIKLDILSNITLLYNVQSSERGLDLPR